MSKRGGQQANKWEGRHQQGLNKGASKREGAWAGIHAEPGTVPAAAPTTAAVPTTAAPMTAMGAAAAGADTPLTLPSPPLPLPFPSPLII